MKILIMNSLDDRYGSTYRIRAFAQELKKLGYSISYFEKKSPFFFKFFEMPFHALFESYDILIVQKFNPLTMLPVIFAKMKRKKTIVDWDDWDTGLQKNSFMRWLTRICETVGPYFPDLITSHNTTLLERIPRTTGHLLIEQGFDEKLFQKKSRQPYLRKIWNLSENQIAIGYMCTFTHGGTLDLEDLLKSISTVQNPNVYFVIIGGGDLLGKYRLLAEELGIQRIVFTGQVSHDEIPDTLAALDAGLVYMADTLANRSRISFKTIEYLASGIPVIGQTVGDTHRIFSSMIHSVALQSLSDYLNGFKKGALTPDNLATERLLKPYAWSKILAKLDHYLKTTGNSCN